MPKPALFDALHRLFVTWDDSADSLGPEWTAMGDRIQAVREALPGHEADYKRLWRAVGEFTRHA